MSSEPIILFDIPDKNGGPWSFNPWKTRFLLNYLGLNYKTEWLEYPDIKTRLEGHIPDTTLDTLYTVPTILLPDGTYIMDSKNIANYLTTAHPTPAIDLFSSPYYPKVLAIMRHIINDSFYPIYIPTVPLQILGPASHEFWYRTRTANPDVGDFDEMVRTKGGDIAWDKTEVGLRAATQLLGENKEGPFFGGKEVAYVDFFWAGFVLFTKSLGEDVHSEFLRRAGEGGKVHLELLEAVRPWMEVK